MNNKNIKNSKILYIGPIYFQYDKYLLKKMRELGAIVKAFELYPDIVNEIYKLLISSRFLKKDSFRHNEYKKILEEKDFDFILIRHGHILTEEFLSELRKNNPSAKFVNFHWDSIKKDYDYTHLFNHFDKIYSFDKADCIKYPEITYLPLFFIDIYGDTTPGDSEPNNDIIFIGAWRNLERYQIVKKIESLAIQNDIRFKHYLHLSIFDQFRSIKNGQFAKQARYRTLTHKEILSMFQNSHAIIDFPSSFQTGLTMRTFEALGAGKKLITTNKQILKEPFYHPEFIKVLDPQNPELDINFIQNKTTGSLKDKLKDYTISSYIYKLLQ